MESTSVLQQFKKKYFISAVLIKILNQRVVMKIVIQVDNGYTRKLET